MTTKARIRHKFQVTIPEKTRLAYPLEEGQYINFEATPRGILLTAAKEVSADQAWFWSPRWTAEERRADKDFQSGRIIKAESADQAIRQLKTASRRKR